VSTSSTATYNASNALAIYYTASPGSISLYIDNVSVTQQVSTATVNVNQIQVGGVADQGLTLLTLDTSAAPPTTNASDSALLGSMYFDTTAGELECYGSSGWGGCGASPNVSANLIPEYSGAVLDGTNWGSNDIGTLTSDLCSNTGSLTVNTGLCATSGQSYNYYAWTSPQATSQTYSIYVRYQLPATFKSFSASNYPQLTGYTTNTTNSGLGTNLPDGVQFSMYDQSGNECGGQVWTVTSSGTTWQSATMTSLSGCTFAASNTITFRIDMTSYNNSYAYASNLSFLTVGK
jgi:hypothetical protein